MTCTPLELLDVATRHWGESHAWLWIFYAFATAVFVGLQIFDIHTWKRQRAELRQSFAELRDEADQLRTVALDARDHGMSREAIEALIAKGRASADAARKLNRKPGRW